MKTLKETKEVFVTQLLRQSIKSQVFDYFEQKIGSLQTKFADDASNILKPKLPKYGQLVSSKNIMKSTGGKHKDNMMKTGPRSNLVDELEQVTNDGGRKIEFEIFKWIGGSYVRIDVTSVVTVTLQIGQQSVKEKGKVNDYKTIIDVAASKSKSLYSKSLNGLKSAVKNI